MLKVIFKNIPKTTSRILKLKYNQAYYFRDANEILEKLQEASQVEKTEKGKYLSINFELVNQEGVTAYIMEDYILDSRDMKIEGIVKHDLDTNFIDNEDYDQGLSDSEEDKKALLKEIKDSLDVSSQESDVAVKKSTPTLFKKIMGRKKKANEAEIEEILANEDDIPSEPKTTSTAKPLVPFTDEVEEKEEKYPVYSVNSDQEEEAPPSEVIYSSTNDKKAEVKEVEKLEITQQEINKQPDVIKPTDSKQSKIIIPSFEYRKPVFEKLSDDIFTAEVQEWLNVMEIEKAQVTNQKIASLNSLITQKYLELEEKSKTAVQEFISRNKPSDEALTEFKVNLQNKHQEVLKEYTIEKSDYYNDKINLKSTEIENEIEQFKLTKYSELEQYKKDMGNNLNSDIDQKSSELRGRFTSALEAKKKEGNESFNKELEEFKLKQEKHVIKTLNDFYQSMNVEEYPEIIKFVESIDQKMLQVKAKVQKHQKELEEQKTLQEQAQLEQDKIRLQQSKLDTEQKQIALEEKELKAKENEKLLQEEMNKKKELELEDRRLKLEEDKLQNERDIAMKKLELKYSRSIIEEKQIDQSSDEKIVALTDGMVEKKEVDKARRSGVIAGLIAPLLLIGAGGVTYAMMDDHADSKEQPVKTYEQAVEKNDYKTVAKKYPEKLDEYSKELLEENDGKSLNQLEKVTDNKLVNFRSELIKRNPASIKKAFESLNDYDGLSKDELKNVADIYMADNEISEVKKINKVLNDESISKALKKQAFYEDKKKTLEKIISDNNDADAVKVAKSELQEVKFILNES